MAGVSLVMNLCMAAVVRAWGVYSWGCGRSECDWGLVASEVVSIVLGVCWLLGVVRLWTLRI